MGLNLANLLMGSLANDSSLNALAGKTGLSTKNLSKLLTAALPMLIKFLTSNAGSAEGAQSLLGALGGHKDTRAMADQIKDADADDGKKILGHILGSESETVFGKLAQETDLQPEQVSTALSNVAPAMMSGLSAATTSASKVDLSDGVDLSDLMGMFGGSMPDAKEATGLLGGLLGGGSGSGGIGSLLGGLFGGGKEKDDDAQDDGAALLGALTSLLK